jgi:hypothetical protein
MILINGQELPQHISYSSLTTWLSCGHLYLLTRIMQVAEEPSAWLYGGKALHKATELYDLQTLEESK